MSARLLAISYAPTATAKMPRARRSFYYDVRNLLAVTNGYGTRFKGLTNAEELLSRLAK
jgi:hypothetical protein